MRPGPPAAAAVLALAAVAGVIALGGLRRLRPAQSPAAAVRNSVMPLADLFRTPEALYADGVKLLGKLDAARAQEQFGKAVQARKDYWGAHSRPSAALARSRPDA